MPLPPERNEYSAVMEGGPYSTHRPIALWRRFYGRLDYEDPLQKTLASSGIGTVLSTPISFLTNIHQPLYLYVSFYFL